MPKTKKVAVSYNNLYLEILGLLISEGCFQFATLVNLYKTTKQLHVFFFNCRIPLAQDFYHPGLILIDVNGNWDTFWQCRKLELFTHRTDSDSFNIITSLIANGEVELAIQIIQKLGCDPWNFYKGVAANGSMAVAVRFYDLIKADRLSTFIFCLSKIYLAPKLSTEIFDHFNTWVSWNLRAGWSSERIAKTMICGHSKPGLLWYLHNLRKGEVGFKLEPLDRIYKFCQRRWDDPEILAMIKATLDEQSLLFEPQHQIPSLE
jgi:hypothetical protein